MSVEISLETQVPRDVLEQLIARHGLFRVMLALPGVLLQRRAGVTLLIPPIPDHLARDIGLQQEPVRRTCWEYR